MYNNTNNNRRSFRPSQGGRYNRPKSYSSSHRGNQRKARNMIVDPNMYIKKAEPVELKDYQVTHTFNDFDFATPLRENIAKQGFVNPTPIQDQAINSILEGRDVIGLASTGTGKTGAFLLPLINNMFKTRDQKTLIIAPTRELAVQINDEFRKFAAGMKLYSATLIGGMNIARQMHDIRRNPHVVIATPGRLKDMINRKYIDLEEYKNIVLDEVDLMVDIGFINDVKYFISLLPKNRQSLFFSATISPKIRTILENFVTNPVTVSVSKQSTSNNVDQDVIKTEHPSKKVDQLHDLLIQDGFDKVLIFGRTKHGVEKLHKELLYRGFKSGAIHGNKNQSQRQKTLARFKQNEIQILLATDVAARGLDIDNVTHVINYELPEKFDDYIHRIGRTGRAGNRGTALTFID
jgi:superfamily II DNA/RNA helicase